MLQSSPVKSSAVVNNPERNKRMLLENGVLPLETKELSTFLTVSSRTKQRVICRLQTKRWCQYPICMYHKVQRLNWA
jgi:hypothetical protein